MYDATGVRLHASRQAEVMYDATGVRLHAGCQAEVMYDATGVRLHAGRQAELQNSEVPSLYATRSLRECTSHSVAEINGSNLSCPSFVTSLDWPTDCISSIPVAPRFDSGQLGKKRSGY